MPLISMLFLLRLAPLAEARDRQPYVVDASSVSATVCWRERRKDACLPLSGLEPGKDFEYFVSSRQYAGRTLPAAGAPLRFAVFGDSGMGTLGQKKVGAVL